MGAATRQLVQRLYVNIYPHGIGGVIGFAYQTREDADRSANAHRIECIEFCADPAAFRGESEDAR